MLLIACSLPKEGINAARRIGELASRMLKTRFMHSETDPQKQKIKQMVVMSRVDLFRTLLPLTARLNTCLLLDYFVRNRLLAVFLWSCYGVPSEVEDAAQHMTTSMVLLFRQFVTNIWLAFPRLQTPSCIRFGIVLLYVRLAFEAHVQCEGGLAVWVAVTAPVRLGASLMLGDVLVTTCLNVLLSTMVICFHTDGWHLTSQVYTCACIFCVNWAIDCLRYAQCKSVLGARISHSVEVAADGLLSQLCDAVVHLGEDMRITQPSPHLEALVLWPSSCGGMRNVSFLDLFSCSVESERVRGVLLRDTPGADMLHASMKDSNDVDVTAQLFHICGKDFDDQIFTWWACGRTRSRSGCHPRRRMLQRMFCTPPPCAPSRSRSTRPPTVRAPGRFSWGATAGTWPCISGFTVPSGPSALGTRLLEWMVSAESFAERVQELCESALRHGRDLNTERTVQVRLRPPHLHRLGRELSAEAVLSLLHNDADADVQLWTAKMELYETKVVRKRSKSEKVHMQFRTLSKRPASVASIEEVSDELDLLEEIDVYFKVLENGYPVTACCSRFASFVGLPEGGIRLLDLAVNPEDLILPTQAVFSAAYHSGDFTSSQMCRGVRLKRARKSTSQLSYGFRATVALSMDHNAGSEDANEWTVKAILSDVMKAPRHARSGGVPSAAPEGHCAGDPRPVGRAPTGSLQRRRARTSLANHDI
ncbi:unnamed protein product [Prorocentrum cordatum]|uniref:Uncharacterized protein n=2 Tax=Prorocentrum cordatum TaxID=2364126 RepID=A0ABN9UD84_9DINO|nr:unnamed protein product [Polarella glacialis]